TGAEIVEPLLSETIPSGVPIERVQALPASLTAVAGVGNIALRALPFLYREGSRIIRQHHIDLVYFSTTMFLSMPLGRMWKRKFHTPYVLDFQDPWLSDYYETHPQAQAAPKYCGARRVHAMLEPWTLKTADGLVSVSADYLEKLGDRYEWTRQLPSMTLPFGASRADFDLLANRPQANHHFVSG